MIYAVAIFLSSFLLFLVQPLIARLILPWFGGGAAVWTTCMLFFQSLLLAGDAHAHAANARLARGGPPAPRAPPPRGLAPADPPPRAVEPAGRRRADQHHPAVACGLRR